MEGRVCIPAIQDPPLVRREIAMKYNIQSICFQPVLGGVIEIGNSRGPGTRDCMPPPAIPPSHATKPTSRHTISPPTTKTHSTRCPFLPLYGPHALALLPLSRPPLPLSHSPSPASSFHLALHSPSSYDFPSPPFSHSSLPSPS